MIGDVIDVRRNAGAQPLGIVRRELGQYLLVLAQGAVYAAYVTADAISPLRALIDLRGDRPESRAAPPHAHKW